MSSNRVESSSKRLKTSIKAAGKPRRPKKAKSQAIRAMRLDFDEFSVHLRVARAPK